MEILEKVEIMETNPVFFLILLGFAVLGIFAACFAGDRKHPVRSFAAIVVVIACIVGMFWATFADVFDVPTGRYKYTAVLTDGSTVDRYYIEELEKTYYNIHRDDSEYVVTFEDLPDINNDSLENSYFLARLWAKWFDVPEPVALNKSDVAQSIACWLLICALFPMCIIVVCRFVAGEDLFKDKEFLIFAAVCFLLALIVAFGYPVWYKFFQ